MNDKDAFNAFWHRQNQHKLDTFFKHYAPGQVFNHPAMPFCMWALL